MPKEHELPDNCKTCSNLRIFSLFMDNNHDYDCGKYPITKVMREHYCPKEDKISRNTAEENKKC